jgi:uncharacterized protein
MRLCAKSSAALGRFRRAAGQIGLVLAGIALAAPFAIGQMPDTAALGLNPAAASLGAINKAKGQDIILRWAPDPAGLWLNSLRGFYTIEKQEFKTIADFHPEKYTLVHPGLRPWPAERILEAFESGLDSSLLIAGQCLYGEWESIDTTQELDIKALYDRNQELTNRYGIALFAADRYPLAAEAMALRYTDENAYTQHSVIYRISLFIDSVLAVQTTTVFDGFDQKVFKPALKSYGEEEGKVILSWDRKIHEQSYTAYWIERSKDQQRFERINAYPYVHAQDVNNSLGEADINYIIPVANYDPYYYRIVGIDAFGDESEPSEAVRLMGRDRSPPPVPDAPRAYMPDETYMAIEWAQDSIADDLAGYYILYAAERDGVYAPLSEALPPAARRHKDYFPNYFGQNYYRICAIDTAGNTACTNPVYGFIQDTIPPGKPVGLKAKIDSSGIVTLHWPLGPERDIMGYNVYFSNRYNGVFSILTTAPVRDTLYRDTINLNSLTKEAFYRIAAVDVRSNTSAFSDMAMVVRPDTIPPGPAVFTRYELRDNGVYLEWAPSGSRDVVSHQLFRQSGDSSFVLRQVLDDSGGPIFLDSLVEAATLYTYRIIAVDASGLRSTSVKDLTVRTLAAKGSPEISLEVSQDARAVTIQYRLSEPQRELRRVVLLRSVDEGPFLTWKSIEQPDFSPISDKLEPNRKHSYKAMAITDKGQKTQYSTIKTVNYEME